jgi:rRNA maturation endonuclease Nob1
MSIKIPGDHYIYVGEKLVGKAINIEIHPLDTLNQEQLKSPMKQCVACHRMFMRYREISGVLVCPICGSADK